MTVHTRAGWLGCGTAWPALWCRFFRPLRDTWRGPGVPQCGFVNDTLTQRHPAMTPPDRPALPLPKVGPGRGDGAPGGGA